MAEIDHRLPSHQVTCVIAKFDRIPKTQLPFELTFWQFKFKRARLGRSTLTLSLSRDWLSLQRCSPNSQLAKDQVQSLDLKRTFLFTLLGFVLVGPTLHFWYLYLSKLVTLPGASGALLRLVLDQFLYSPIFIGVFLTTLVTLEGRPSQFTSCTQA